MSTRCVINFNYGSNVIAKVYRHNDGYPEGVLPDLESFFKDVKSQTVDTRFSDPSYLAARFVVWQADQHVEVGKSMARDYDYYGQPGGMLDFLGVGVVQEDPEDIEYAYFVDCQHREDDGIPKVTHARA